MQDLITPRIGLRVSKHALCLASPVFKAILSNATTEAQQPTGDKGPQNVVSLLDDDGDAVYILTNILHLRNDKLPARLLPSLLCKVASLAHKYQCVVAAGRATLQWFDRLYASSSQVNTWEIIEAAFLLDEAMFFARFTSRWVLQQSLYTRQMPAATMSEAQKLARKSHLSLICVYTTRRQFAVAPTVFGSRRRVTNCSSLT